MGVLKECGICTAGSWGVTSGGRGGIRTLGTVTRTPDFESGTLNQLSHPSFLPLVSRRSGVFEGLDPGMARFFGRKLAVVQ